MDEKHLLTWGFSRIIGLLLFLGLAACTPKGEPALNLGWLPSQVRSLDPAESTPNPIQRIQPSQDLIALYTRETQDELHIRLDLLDLELSPTNGLPITPNFDLYITLDRKSGTPIEKSDLLIQIPAEGMPSTLALNSETTIPTNPQVVFESPIDAVTIRLDRQSLPTLSPLYVIRAFLTNPGSTTIIDEIPAVYSTAHVEPIPILLAFWNALPAHTPAQALRRWDGAHTGPSGERHGLKHLLNASQKNQIPIVLLDLKTPASLSSLDALGQTNQLIDLERQGLVILPEPLPENYFGNLPEWMVERTANISRQTSLAFGLSGSPFVYAPFVPEFLPFHYRLGLVRNTAVAKETLPITQITENNGQRYLEIPLTGNPRIQATDQGLPIELRRELLQLALNQEDKSRLAVLGGDLPHSTWGDPQAARVTLYYIAQHPWMDVLDETGLLDQQVCEDCPPIQLNAQKSFDHPVIAELQQAPESAVSALAWQMFLDLSAPEATFDIAKLAALRTNYLGEIGNFLAAAKWENAQTNPESAMGETIKIDCSQDTDFDSQPECILANEKFFVLLDPEGGRLSYLFVRGPGGVTQIVGPSSQFIVGLSDPREWNLAAGPLADPLNISGAFAIPWKTHQVETLENGIRFLAPGIEKTFQLTETGLRGEIRSEPALNYQIPLAVAPETRFQPAWMDQYQETKIPQGLIWGIKDGTKIKILSSDEISNHKFQDTYFFLAKPEDPNLGYPPGHFIPFPMAILDLTAQPESWVEFRLADE